jgi:hypothetical protein
MSRLEKPGTAPHRPREEPAAPEPIRMRRGDFEPAHTDDESSAVEWRGGRLPEAREIGQLVLIEAARRLVAAHGLANRVGGPRLRRGEGRA